MSSRIWSLVPRGIGFAFASWPRNAKLTTAYPARDSRRASALIIARSPENPCPSTSTGRRVSYSAVANGLRIGPGSYTVAGTPPSNSTTEWCTARLAVPSPTRATASASAATAYTSLGITSAC